ncbi:MAG: phosphomannomutase/phosphoglucomutase [Gammaproteobacteria bacterium]|nr:MAG: phosphomannomutase [Pseudomonadota bacterium]MBC6945348.1 phosphomannomutase [Gammaproteobacteria bacterium]MCE7895469.1 phosphomannomutase [Gammaproteobacteria bacterium PRO8]MDL1880518.1 phosphomannomutase [Gammaproteobacteria bacterium PRO2]MCQ3934295.1 phosphomannomutase [Gammaproteobacteria bacterium]
MTEPLTCFKAYDIRGRIPGEINEDVACRIGRAFGEFLAAGEVVVGHDIRLSGPVLSAALARGLNAVGVDVIDIGLCGTEEVYFATSHLGAGGGIMVTASHNPADYNGMKLVRAGSRPVSGDTGLLEIRRRAEELAGAAIRGMPHQGGVRRADPRQDYVRHLLGYVDRDRLKPLHLVMNAGNGSAGPVVDALERELPFRLTKVQHQPDGRFPNGVPNPLLPENREATSRAIRSVGADFGVAWDGDFDRCFLFDERGEFIEGYYVVGLLAEAMLAAHPGARIIHDPRLVWNTEDIVRKQGGIAVQSKTGHAFIKERMRHEDAVYGGEMSAHHYFRDFAYCDSGMIPWLLVAGLVSSGGRPLSALVADRIRRFPVSGEINRQLADPAAALARVRARYAPGAEVIDETDGLGIAFQDWRFNLRASNTEPVIRLNVESRGDVGLMQAKTAEILALLSRH